MACISLQAYFEEFSISSQDTLAILMKNPRVCSYIPKLELGVVLDTYYNSVSYR